MFSEYFSYYVKYDQIYDYSIIELLFKNIYLKDSSDYKVPLLLFNEFM